MSVQLLDKTRKINRLLHNNTSVKFMFNDICDVLSDVLSSNTLVISKKGKVLGINIRGDIPGLSSLLPGEKGDMVDSALNERFLNVLSTMENISLTTFGLTEGGNNGYEAIIVPIDISGERLGTLFVYRLDKIQKSIGLDLRNFDDAITFKIAYMVSKYMKYMENNNY